LPSVGSENTDASSYVAAAPVAAPRSAIATRIV
jgi:hypothetical protein